MNLSQKSQWIKEQAKALGFLSCGISKAGFLEEEAPRLEQWLQANHHGQMSYMANHFDKRLDPTKLVEGAKSVISVLYNYFPKKKQNPESYQISKYAYGEDYHFVVKDHLRTLLHKMQDQFGDFYGRAFVDSAPILEKAWAAKSGLGWVGKNANLITKRVGSYYFIAELIVDLDLEPDAPTTDHCGSCTACIDACPTDAIIRPYVVDGSKCISYATIELKDQIPSYFLKHMDDWMFGCDVCQEVCPWNRFATPHQEPRFTPNEKLLRFSKKEWEEITEEVFQEIFKKSAVKRTKFSGLQRNIQFLKE